MKKLWHPTAKKGPHSVMEVHDNDVPKWVKAGWLETDPGKHGKGKKDAQDGDVDTRK